MEEKPDYAGPHSADGRLGLSLNVREPLELKNTWRIKSTEWGAMSLFDRNKPRLLKNPSSEANLPELSESIWLPL